MLRTCMLISTIRGSPATGRRRQRHSRSRGYKFFCSFLLTSYPRPEAVVVVLEQVVQEERDVLGRLGEVANQRPGRGRRGGRRRGRRGRVLVLIVVARRLDRQRRPSSLSGPISTEMRVKVQSDGEEEGEKTRLP